MIVQDKQGTALLVNGILVGMGHNSRTCFSQPGIYTRISNQAYWIQSTMNNNQASLTQGSTNNNPGYWIPVTTNNNQNTNQGWSFPDPRWKSTLRNVIYQNIGIHLFSCFCFGGRQFIHEKFIITLFQDFSKLRTCNLFSTKLMIFWIISILYVHVSML